MKHVNISKNTKFFDASNDIRDNDIENHAESVSFLTLKCDLKVAKVKLDASKRLASELERTINNQELIISLLQNPKNLEVNYGPNTNNRSAVATVSLKSEYARIVNLASN
ncbi:unnamed protein product [Psylliodes chrysocephalus]|uniref:Uncharacterized protein n=1 Tax=Psylliodes chrysocephalus TaxID=3402493 RepID=A0A9P0D2J1_9CUCU|nr:unnamed protein product [Psylliodes chrysocephala]